MGNKTYVFWRMPDGRPYKGKNGRYSPSKILARFGEITSVDPQGKVSWQGFDYKRFEMALKFASVVIRPDGEELNETDSWSIIQHSLIEAVKSKGGKQPLLPNEYLKIADIKAAEYFRRPKESYTLVTGLSVETIPFKSIVISGCRVQALPSRHRYPYPQHITSRIDLEMARKADDSGYRPARVRTKGRTHFEAVDEAFRALHLLTGLWSLFSTYGAWSMSLSGTKRDSIGSIHSGPIHTLHHANGKLATEMYWYERHSGMGRNLYKPTAGWKRVEQLRRWAVRRLSRLPYRKDLEDLIIRYQIALEQPDHEIAFLQMWSILEKITHTIGTNYDETVKRTIWIIRDKAISKELLECARSWRNLYVHAARSTEAPDQTAYLTKTFVDPHLLALIRNDLGVSTLEEYGQHLTLPTDLNTLEREKKWISRTLQMIRNRTKAKP